MSTKPDSARYCTITIHRGANGSRDEEPCDVRGGIRAGPAVTEAAEELIAGRYRLDVEIGSGGMGVVWRGRDELLGRTVAVKALSPRSMADGPHDDRSARRAMREARIAARLHHPNVIGIYDVVEHEGRPFLIMEFLPSRSLSELLAEREVLPPHEVVRIGAQLAAGLAEAHKAGIVHRDVKPGNVLLAGDADGTAKLTDFGISRAVGDTTVTASGVLLGTLAYIAPEVGRGQSADSRTDVYSLGATLYSAVEGKPPFGNDDNAIALLYRIVHEDITLPRNAGPLAPVLLWMLEREPELRPTMQQVQHALEAIEAADDVPPVTLEIPDSNEVPEASAAAAAAAVAAESEEASEASEASSDDIPDAASAPEAASAPDDPAAESDGGTGEAPDAAPAAESAAVSAAGGTSPSGSSSGKKRRALAAALVAALIVAITTIVLVQRDSNQPTASSSTPSGSHSAGTGATAGASTPATHPASTNAQAGTGSSASAPPATTTATSSSPTTSASQSSASQLASTITDYYKLMPGDLTDGWNWMTAYYQQNHAGGLNGYQKFWNQIQRVTASNVTATLPSTVVATIDYYYKNGSVVEERTSYGLIFEQGRWKISTSYVISGRTLK